MIPFTERFNTLTKINMIDDKSVSKATGAKLEDVEGWHTGKVTPSAEELFRFCMAYNYSPDFILGMAGDKRPFIATYPDVRILGPAPMGYDANLLYMTLLMKERRKELEKEKPEEITMPFDKAAMLPDDIREGIIALLRLERQIYESCITQEEGSEDAVGCDEYDLDGVNEDDYEYDEENYDGDNSADLVADECDATSGSFQEEEGFGNTSCDEVIMRSNKDMNNRPYVKTDKKDDKK